MDTLTPPIRVCVSYLHLYHRSLFYIMSLFILYVSVLYHVYVHTSLFILYVNVYMPVFSRALTRWSYLGLINFITVFIVVSSLHYYYNLSRKGNSFAKYRLYQGFVKCLIISVWINIQLSLSFFLSIREEITATKAK